MKRIFKSKLVLAALVGVDTHCSLVEDISIFLCKQRRYKRCESRCNLVDLVHRPSSDFERESRVTKSPYGIGSGFTPRGGRPFPTSAWDCVESFLGPGDCGYAAAPQVVLSSPTQP